MLRQEHSPELWAINELTLNFSETYKWRFQLQLECFKYTILVILHFYYIEYFYYIECFYYIKYSQCIFVRFFFAWKYLIYTVEIEIFF